MYVPTYELNYSDNRWFECCWYSLIYIFLSHTYTFHHVLIPLHILPINNNNNEKVFTMHVRVYTIRRSLIIGLRREVFIFFISQYL